MASPGRRAPLLHGHKGPPAKGRSHHVRDLRLSSRSSSGALWMAAALGIAIGFYILYQRINTITPGGRTRVDTVWDTPETLHLLHATPSEAFCRRQTPPHVCAHGGDPQSAPPNTLRAFHVAAAAGYECIEVDVVLSADSVPVVLHVRELRSLLRASGDSRTDLQVGDLTWQELESLQWPEGDRVAKASDVIMAIQSHVNVAILDVKTYNGPGGEGLDQEQVSNAVVELVKSTNCHKCLVWAKHDAIVHQVKTALPHIRAGYIVMDESLGAVEDGMHMPLQMDVPEVAGVHHGMLDDSLLSSLHQSGKQGYGWTADQPNIMRKLLDVGVDAIVTSHPQRLSRIIAKLRKDCDIKERNADI